MNKYIAFYPPNGKVLTIGKVVGQHLDRIIYLDESTQQVGQIAENRVKNSWYGKKSRQEIEQDFLNSVDELEFILRKV